MREHEEVQKMGHIVQRLVRNAIMQAVNQVIQNKTQQEAAKFGNEWKGSFHCLVSGYYSGMTVKYLMLPFAVFCILCAIGSGIAGGLTYSIWFLVIAFTGTMVWHSMTRMAMNSYSCHGQPSSR